MISGREMYRDPQRDAIARETMHLPVNAPAEKSAPDMRYFRSVLDKAARLNEIQPDAILSTSRTAEIVRARRYVCQTMRKHGWSFPRIGKALGMHHSSIMHLCRKPAPLEPIQGPWFVPDYSGEWAI